MTRRVQQYLVLFLIPFATLDSGTDGSLYPFAVLSAASVLVLTLAVLSSFAPSPAASGRAERSKPWTRSAGCNATALTLLLVLVWGAASLIYTIDRPSSEYGLVRIFNSAVLLLVVPVAFPTRENQTIFWKAAVLWAGLLSVAGLAQLVFASGQYGPRAHSLFVTPNTFAGYLLITLPVAFGLLQQSATAGERRLWAACALAQAAAFAATGSRGAWLALLGAGLLWTATLLLTGRLHLEKLRAFGWRQRWAVVVLFAICASVIGYQASRDQGMTARLLSLAHPLTAEPDRLRYWASTLDIVRTRPWLGYGLNTFRFIYVGYKSRELGNHIQFFAHNDYLQMAAETGLVGLGLFLLLSALVARAGWRALRRDGGPLAAALALGVWGVLLHSLVDYDFHIPAIQTHFWLATAFLLTAAGAATPRPGGRSGAPAYRKLAGAAAILLAVCVGVTVARNYLAERASAQGLLLVRRHDLAGARRRFADAIGLVPYSSYHLAGLARVAILEGELQNDPGPLREAVRHLDKALALNPYDADTRVLLAQLYSRNPDLLGLQARSRLLAVLEEGVALLPNADVFRRQLGRVLLEGGETARAVEQLERCLVGRPRDTTVRLLLAQAYSRTGRPDDAAAQAREILALDPNNVEAASLLGRPALR